MDEYRRLQFLASRLDDQAREAAAARRAHQATFRPGVRHGLLALTALLLGMLAWWGR